MSRDLLILGAGGVGAHAARLCARRFPERRIVILDKDAAIAVAIAGEIGANAAAGALDVTDEARLKAYMSDAEIVLNCVGPYYKFAAPILDAAIAVGALYLDVNDDWEPTLTSLERDAAAKERDARAVIGMGASPGLCNLLAVAAARAIGAPTRLITGWTLENDPGPPGSAAQAHWLHQSSGLIRVLESGVFVDRPPLQAMEVHWPGRGARAAQTVGHPEAVTLPRTFPTLRECVNVMVLHPQLAAALADAAGRIDSGALDVHAAVDLLTRGYEPNGAPEPEPHFPGIFAIASRPGAYAFAAPSFLRGADVAEVTARPLVAALAVALEKGLPCGVHAPEAVFEPADVFAELAAGLGHAGPLFEIVVA